MNANVTEAINTWNAEHAKATKELAALELALKADYNKYVDSLCAYLHRLKEANDIRQGYIRKFSISDNANETRKCAEFGSSSKQAIENQADKYLLERPSYRDTSESRIKVRALGYEALLERKVL
jgi:hypothetical protein